MPEKNNGIAERQIESSINTPKETLILATRQHWYVLLIPIATTFFLGILFIASLFLASFYFLLPYKILVATGIIGFLVFTNLIIKMIVDWYFHFYVVTTRKIIETTCAPLFSHNINEILLDQVRCTEIDIHVDGFLKEIINIGDIAVTFDRPTHQEEFILTNIKDPKKIGMFLGDILHVAQHYGEIPMWYKDRNKENNRFHFFEELYPINGKVIGGNFG